MRSNRTAARDARRARRVFTAAFKAEAIRWVAARRASGQSLAQLGRELYVRPDQVARVGETAPDAGASTLHHGETLEQHVLRNRIWVGDITYVPTPEAFLHLATVRNLADRTRHARAADCPRGAAAGARAHFPP